MSQPCAPEPIAIELHIIRVPPKNDSEGDDSQMKAAITEHRQGTRDTTLNNYQQRSTNLSCRVLIFAVPDPNLTRRAGLRPNEISQTLLLPQRSFAYFLLLG